MSDDGSLDEEIEQLNSPPLRYDGEDTSPTTTRELQGWYAYPIAAEVFAVVAVGTYCPLNLLPIPTTKFSVQALSCL